MKKILLTVVLGVAVARWRKILRRRLKDSRRPKDNRRLKGNRLRRRRRGKRPVRPRSQLRRP